MRITAAISLWIVRLVGPLQVVLGMLFWAGYAYVLLPLHLVGGALIVLALWTAAVLALVVGVRRSLALFGLLWGLALPAFGIWQTALLVGPLHWIVRVVHLLMGIAAMRVAGTLSLAILAAVPARARRPEIESGAAVASRTQ